MLSGSRFHLRRYEPSLAGASLMSFCRAYKEITTFPDVSDGEISMRSTCTPLIMHWLLLASCSTTRLWLLSCTDSLALLQLMASTALAKMVTGSPALISA